MHKLSIGGNKTVSDWLQFVWDITHQYFANNFQQIGGPGHTVQIDESLFSRAKYNRGRARRAFWIFGGYDCTTGLGFLVPVPNRSRNILIPLIREQIAPGSTIVSDMWRAYDTIHEYGYNHLRVNHSVNFVDPITGAHTNNVENMWKKAKAKFKSMEGMNRLMINSYLLEYMWWQRHRDSCFFHFWDLVSQYYPCN